MGYAGASPTLQAAKYLDGPRERFGRLALRLSARHFEASIVTQSSKLTARISRAARSGADDPRGPRVI